MAVYRITTPEQVQFHFEIAGLVTRAMAWCLDQVILMTTVTAVFIVLAKGGQEVGLALALVCKFLLDFGYYTWFEQRWAGQTPGKRFMRIRVISSTGARLRFPDTLMRTLVRMLDNPSLLPFVGMVGGAAAWLDPYHRRLGDLAADTIVIRDVRVSLPAKLGQGRARVNSFAADPALRSRVAARVTRAERDLMYDLMLRRDSLEPDMREALFRDAASHFRERYGLPEDAQHLSDEQTVLNLALLVQDTRFAG